MVKTETSSRYITKLYKIAEELKANLDVGNIEFLATELYKNVNELNELTATELSNAIYDTEKVNDNNASIMEAKEANATERYKLMEHIVLSASGILNSAIKLSDSTREILVEKNPLHLESFIAQLDTFNGLLKIEVA